MCKSLFVFPNPLSHATKAMKPRIFQLIRVAGPPIKLGVAIVRFWIILLTTPIAKSGGTHCAASLVGNFATRPVTLNISVKVL